jgi:uncharacterized membrane protein HdeD (DUF308 family)
MVGVLSRNWWVFLVRGILAILFGIMAWVWPGITISVLVLFFGAYALVDGIFSIVAAFSARGTDPNWWAELIEGIVGILAGIAVFFWPGLSALVLLYLIAAWAIITGIFEVIAAIQLRKEITGEWFLALAGVASIIFGIIAFLFPGAGALAVIWLIAVYAIVFGIALVALAFRVRGLDEPTTAA